MKYIVWSSLAAWAVLWFGGHLVGTSQVIVYAEIALTVYCLGIGFLVLMKSPATPFCWTFFWLFHAYFIFIPSLATYISKLSTWGTYYSLSDYQNGYLTYTGWIAVVLAGYSYRKTALREQWRVWTPGARNNVAILLLTLPLLAAIAAVPSDFVAERHELADDLAEGGLIGYFLTGSKMLFLAAAIYALNIWKANQRLLWLIMRVGITLMVFVVFNPFSNPRYIFLSADLAILGSWLPLRRYAMIGLVILGPVLIFLVLPLTKVMFNSDAFSREATRNTKDYLVSTEFDAFQQSMNSVAYVESNGYNYGSQLLAAPLFWVPRSFFPDKPESSGANVADFMGYIYLNLALPLYAEFYLAFGLPGILFFGFLWGILLRRADNNGCNFKDPNGHLSFWRLNSLLLGSFSFIIYRGSLGALAPIVGAIAVGVILLWVMLKLRFGRRAKTAKPTFRAAPSAAPTSQYPNLATRRRALRPVD